jgi:hypothetical protein
MTLMLNVNEKWFKKLMKLPESGMGYQLVDIYLKNGHIMKKIVVVDSEIICLPEGFEDTHESDITEIKMSYPGNQTS